MPSMYNVCISIIYLLVSRNLHSFVHLALLTTMFKKSQVSVQHAIHDRWESWP